jgi:hypothetical protein
MDILNFLSWVTSNWEIITLIVTNIAALFVKPPLKKRE